MLTNIPDNVFLYVYGHSFGGIYMRYALGELYKAGEIKKRGWTLSLFMTTASPHLGIESMFCAFVYINPPYPPVLFCLLGMFESNFLVRILARIFIGQTGKDLFMHSNMLDELATGHYLEALRQFNHRIVIGNMKNDNVVGPATSLISTHIKYIGGSGITEYVPSVGSAQVAWTRDDGNVLYVVPDTFSEGDKSAFKEDYAIPDDMFKRIGKMAVALDDTDVTRFRVAIDDADAHVCIIEHNPYDKEGIGHGIVEKICDLFFNISGVNSK